MDFTDEHRNAYLNQIVTKTHEGIVMAEISALGITEKIEKKKALLTEVQQKINSKEFKSANEGKRAIQQVESDIANFEHELNETLQSIQSGWNDLELIERYRNHYEPELEPND